MLISHDIRHSKVSSYQACCNNYVLNTKLTLIRIRSCVDVIQGTQLEILRNRTWLDKASSILKIGLICQYFAIGADYHRTVARQHKRQGKHSPYKKTEQIHEKIKRVYPATGEAV